MIKNTGKLAGKTVYITGGSRGIGREIALKLAKDKANIIIAAKTAETNPKLPGTIYSVAKEIEAAGGKALACIVDIRDENQVNASVEEGVKKFGGIDILVNNASAISLTNTTDTSIKKFDLMNQINHRGTFIVSKACIPHLKKGKSSHILNLSPPLNLNPLWFKNHVAYTIAKYNMSLQALGMSEELKGDGIAVNCLWPKTAIYTAAMEMLGGGPSIKTQCRDPSIIADSAYTILCKDPSKYTGNFAIDEDVLKEEGIKDFKPYEYSDAELMPDFFLDDKCNRSIHWSQYGINLGGTQPTTTTATASKPAESGSKSAPASDSQIGKIMESVRGIITEEIVQKTQSVFLFDVKGASGSEQWYLDLKNAPGGIGQGEPSSKPNVTLSLAEADFVKLFGGKLSPTSAYMTGKLKLKGDITKAMVLDKLMGKLKSKL